MCLNAILAALIEPPLSPFALGLTTPRDRHSAIDHHLQRDTMAWKGAWKGGLASSTMVLFNVASPRTACWAIRSQVRSISSSRKPQRIPRGALLYGPSPKVEVLVRCPHSSFCPAVPASSDKFLHSSLRSPAATLTFDLEDSVHASSKPAARARLASFLRELSSPARPPHGLSIAVRPNTLHLPPDEGGLGEDGAVRLASGEEELKEGYGVEDVRSVWGSEGAKRWNDGAGPMMVAPKVGPPDACERA